MAATFAQQSLELPSTSSRQDVVSALLSMYGTLGDDDASVCSSYFPTSPARELLPSSPPMTPEERKKYGNDKSPPHGGRLSMRFQLRVDEPPPQSPIDSQPKRINYRSITRDSKPPSLTLVASNGSTAKVPSIFSLTPSSSRSVPSSRTPRDEKELPPPPPEKPKRSIQQSPFANQETPRRPDRRDSQPSQEEKITATEVVKKNPIPPKFTSLLDMKHMPRGGKGGPLPMPRSRNQNSGPGQPDANRDRPSTAVETNTTMNRLLLPTPVQDEEQQPPPPQPKRLFAGIGLPSNPRAKHVKRPKIDSSSAAVPTPLPPSQAISSPPTNTIAPGITPLPMIPQQFQGIVSPADDGNQRRPFSFEPIPPPLPVVQQTEQQAQQTPNTDGSFILPTLPPTPPPTPASLALPRPDAMISPSHLASRLLATFPSLPSDQNPILPPSSPTITQQEPSRFLPPPVPANLPSQQHGQPISPLSVYSVASPPVPALIPSPLHTSSSYTTNPYTPQPQDTSTSPPTPAASSKRFLPPFSELLTTEPLPALTDPINTIALPNNSPRHPLPSPRNQRAGVLENHSVTAPIPIPIPGAPGVLPSIFKPFPISALSTTYNPINTRQYACYTQHAHHVWSKNEFQPQPCMVCAHCPYGVIPPALPRRDRLRMWACSWCYVRICVRCAEELVEIPGRDLGLLVLRRRRGEFYATESFPAVSFSEFVLASASASTSASSPSILGHVDGSGGFVNGSSASAPAMMPPPPPPPPSRAWNMNAPNGGGGVMSMLVEEPEEETQRSTLLPMGAGAGGRAAGGFGPVLPPPVLPPPRHDSAANAWMPGVRMVEDVRANQQGNTSRQWRWRVNWQGYDGSAFRAFVYGN